jgi:membrane carboxypeptidase/penicillin-binding protein
VHLPEKLTEATVATTDPGFWSHLGFTPAGFIRRDQPTLAQRLVSDLLL